MSEQTKKKTSVAIDPEGLGGGSVEGVIPVQTVLVKYTDGHGVKAVKLAVVVPGGEVYFFDKDAVDERPAQKWLKTAVLEILK
jgi:hypothetical protein